MNEEWRPIIGYLDYFISNQGNVKSLKGKQPRLLKQKTDSDGYKRVALSNGTGKLKHFGVHRLVAIHFIENTDGKPVVNHLDGDKSNNDFTNLEWATISENGKHAYSIGLTKRTKKMQ